MPLFVNTNAMSLQAQRSVGVSAAGLQTSLQRLSSGQRINTAKDDAAGLGLSNRLSTQVNGLNQAARNAQDALSLTQVAEAALGEITTGLQRLRELAVQSANASNSASDRKVLDEEVQQRLAEIDRIASQTRFNGQRLLDGSFGTAQFQVGANAGETLNINLGQSVGTGAIGNLVDYAGSTAVYSSSVNLGLQGNGVGATAWASGSLTVQVGSGPAVAVVDPVAGAAVGQGTGSAWSKAAAVNATGLSGVQAFASTAVTLNWTAGYNNYSLSINGAAVYSNVFAGTVTGDLAAAAINQQSSYSGVTAAWDSTAQTLLLSAADGRDVTISQTLGTPYGGLGLGTTAGLNNAVNSGVSMYTAANSTTTQTFRGSVRLQAAEQLTVAGSGSSALGYTSGVVLSQRQGSLANASSATAADATTMLLRADSALDAISTLRGTLGALGTRIEATINSILVNSENLQAARSRVLDTDYAAETANLTRSQVMQQAATAILSQANAAPQSVLALLK